MQMGKELGEHVRFQTCFGGKTMGLIMGAKEREDLKKMLGFWLQLVDG